MNTDNKYPGHQTECTIEQSSKNNKMNAPYENLHTVNIWCLSRAVELLKYIPILLNRSFGEVSAENDNKREAGEFCAFQRSPQFVQKIFHTEARKITIR